jgi:hypothetical protein
LMRFLRKLFKCAIRLVGWCCSFVFGVLFLFLAGYWLGWKFTPTKTNLSEAAVRSDSGAADRRVSKNGKPRPAVTLPVAKIAQERITRLARLSLSTTDKRETDARIATEIAALNLTDVLAALAVLDHAPASAPLMTLRVRLLERLTGLDPYAALDYAREAAASGRDRDSMLVSTVFQRWAFSDAPTALQAWRDFIAGGGADDERTLKRSGHYGLDEIFFRLGRKDLNLAVDEMKSLPVEQQQRVWDSLSRLAFEDKPRPQLLAAVTALPPGEIRTQALAQMADVWVRSPGQKEAAVQWLDEAQLSRVEQTRIEERIAFYLGPMLESGNWLMDRAQTPEERTRRLDLVMGGWVYHDPVGAGEWLNAQGLDKTAAPAMSRYAKAVVNNHPEAALEWARSIPEEAVRESTLADVERRIRKVHSHRADALLAPESASQ